MQGGACFLMKVGENVSTTQEIVAELQKVLGVPMDQRPELFRYDNMTDLGTMAAAANIDTAYELGYDEKGERRIAKIDIVVAPENSPNFEPMLIEVKDSAAN